MKVGGYKSRNGFVSRFCYLFCVFILAFPSTNAKAQAEQLLFTRLTTDEGLSQNSVTAILQDRTGFIWIATQDGLNRYDGTQFRIFSYDIGDTNSISNNRIEFIHEGRQGQLWVGTRGGGLNIYDPISETFKRLRHKKGISASLSSDLTWCLFEDTTSAEQSFWIGTEKGLNQYFPATNRMVSLGRKIPGSDSLLTDACIYDISRDKRGDIWVATRAGLNRYAAADGRLVHYLHDADDSTSINHSNINRVFCSRNGEVWIATMHGVARYIRATDSFARYIPFPDEPAGSRLNQVYSLLEDRNGNLWATTYGAGVSILDRQSGRFTFYANDPANRRSLSDDQAKSLYEDRTGNIWIGTWLGGVNRYDQYQKAFGLYKHGQAEANGQKNRSVYTIFEDHEKNIWIGTGSGLQLVNPQDGSLITPESSGKGVNLLSGQSVFCVIEDPDPRRSLLWLSGVHGLISYDWRNKRVSQFPLVDGTTKNGFEVYTTSHIIDLRGTVWVATTQGLYWLDSELNRLVNYLPGPGLEGALADEMIISLFLDSAGKLWIGTNGSGLFEMDPLTAAINSFTKEEGNPHSLNDNHVWSFYEDERKNIWFGTQFGGLNYFERATGQFTHLTTRNGLPDNWINRILPDRKGNLWLSTANGLSRFNPERNQFRNYGPDDGLQSTEFTLAGFLASDGKMYFGGTNGYNAFYPDSIHDNPYRPAVVITDFQLFNKQVQVGPDENGRVILDSTISAKKHITLRYDDDVLTLAFAALHYANPHQNQYAYKLAGLESAWRYASDQTSVTYSHLDPGEYIFRVKASNSDGVWNDSGASLRITITPPFWQTRWFLVLSIGFIVLSIWGYIQIRMHKMDRLNQQLENRVRARTVELRETNQQLVHARDAAELAAMAKTEFLANMGHELRTPMHQMLGMVHLLMNTPLNSEQSDYTEGAIASAEHLLRMINDVLDLTNIETGQLTVIAEDMDLRQIVEDVEALLSLKSLEKSLELHCIVEPELPNWLRGDSDRVKQILINLLDNAVKFTDSGSATLVARLVRGNTRNGDLLRFDVSDTGIGIAESRFNEIFESFSQIDSSVTRKYGGTGLGLAICRQLVEMMGGHIEISSALGEGTAISVSLPLIRADIPSESGLPPLKNVDEVAVCYIEKSALRRRSLAAQFSYIGCPHLLFPDVAAYRSHFGDLPTARSLVLFSPEFDSGGNVIDIDIIKGGGRSILIGLIDLTHLNSIDLFKKAGFHDVLNRPVKYRRLHQLLCEHLDEELNEASVAEAENVTEPDTQAVRILLVEDNKVNQKVASRLLQKKGFHVDCALNGKIAVDMLSTETYNLVLMDINMPEMDGVEATRVIRDPSSAVLQHTVPIIALTANAARGDRQKYLVAGMDEYVSKPIKPTDLFEAIEGQLNRKEFRQGR